MDLDSHGNSYAHPERNRYSHGFGDSDIYLNAERYVYSHGYGDSDHNANADTYSVSDGNIDGHSDNDRYAHGGLFFSLRSERRS